jgi:DNA-directed RNA polymerase subunit RPC12/RpoP
MSDDGRRPGTPPHLFPPAMDPAPPPPPDRRENWACRDCRWTNNGARERCRNCGRPREASSPPAGDACPYCSALGFKRLTQPAETARGRVQLCGECGSESQRGPGGDLVRIYPLDGEAPARRR